MNLKKHNQMMMLLTCFVLIASTLPLAHATAQTDQAVVATNEINVRTGPGLSYGIAAVVKRGESYPILTKQGEWVQIGLSNGQKGWVVSWLITTSSGGQKAPKTKTQNERSAGSNSITSTASDLRIRTGPGTSYQVVGTFPQGASAKKLQTSGEWTKISYKQAVGWVHSDYVSGGQKASQSSSGESSRSKQTGTVGVSSLNVRQSAAPNAQVVASLARNTQITILREQNGWYEIEAKGVKGWAASYYIVTSNGTSTAGGKNSSSSASQKKAYIVYDGTNIRKSASTSAQIAERATKGAAYRIVRTQGDWYEVTLSNGGTGYVASWVVQTNKNSSEAPRPKQDSSSGTGSLKGKTIVLDPGHGGKDSGTIGADGAFEKNITIKTANLLAGKLRASGANVYLTRSEDTFISLQSRVATSHYRNADAFISLHYDSFMDSSVRGSTAYYYQAAKDQQLATNVHSEVAKRSQIPDKGVKFGDYFVLRENKRPSLLYELGYLSNPQEEAIIYSASYQERVTEGMTEGLKQYFR
ncbi:N-acetylmuramoyl-L-alanine amidase [Bacillus altitudinis]|uniref:SH3 domain-containing protein n=1 Tax=Bacillus pumilus TaxID=1408 RepID=UPI0025A201E2|nr:N-acetylmuramoyl-L-alanine amidase [Bacillus pumilus]MDM5320826.1 N-acetylmuramoyl-L-alanine amidase [Bacillus pumilus]MDR4995745.1 N-acetylmuramoyl-L-alanine amidase [Bacillus altitudinis]